MKIQTEREFLVHASGLTIAVRESQLEAWIQFLLSKGGLPTAEILLQQTQK